jgi:hypothetical protein
MGDTTLSTFTVNNVAYDNTDEQSITVSPGTTSVPIDIVPPAGATYSVFLTTPTKDQDTATIANGNIEGLETGSNRINVMVEAFGGQGQRNYTFFVTVSSAIPTYSSDNSLGTFFINNVDPLAGGFTVPYGTASVPLFVQASDSNATVEVTYDVSGAATPSPVTLVDYQATITLVAGHILKIVVTAENGSANTRYNQAIPIAAPSSDTSLSSFILNSTDPLSGSFAVPYGTTSVPLVVETNDQNATMVITYDVSGAATPTPVVLVNNEATITLVAGHILKVRVTAEDGTTTTLRYNQAIPIAAPNTDTSLSNFFLNGTDPLENGFSLPYGSTTTEIQVQQNDQNATVVVTYDVSGAANPSPVTFVDYTGTITLVAGHILKVRVTAEDGTTSTLRYNQAIPIAAPSSNTSLMTFFLNGTDPLENGFSLPYGSTTTEIAVASDDSNATVVVTYDVSGAATPSPVTLVDGIGTITLVAGHILKVLVTAQDNTTSTLRYNQEIPVEQEGVINTDPYVSTFAGVRYKLPSIDAPIRYFQTMEDGKLLTINAQLKTCSSADLDVSNIRSLLALKNKMTAKQYNVIAQKLMTPETLSFCERVHIQYGEESLVVNLWNSKFEVLKNNLSVKAKVVDRPDLIEKTGIYTGYKASTLKFTFGTTKLFLSVYNSPMIRNGLSVATCAKNCNGVIVNALKQSDMVLPSLDSVQPVAKKDSAKRHVHAETFVDHDGLRTRNIVTYR